MPFVFKFYFLGYFLFYYYKKSENKNILQIFTTTDYNNESKPIRST